MARPSATAAPKVDTRASFRLARQLDRRGLHEQADVLYRRGLEAYDWRRLYDLLMKLKKEWPRETGLVVELEGGAPLALLMRLMDVARFQLGGPDGKCAQRAVDALGTESRPYCMDAESGYHRLLFPDVRIALGLR